MSPRPYWKGYLKLALVSCPIALHAVCSSAERISFRQINRFVQERLERHLKRRSQRPFRLAEGSWYAQLKALGLRPI